MIAKIFGTPKTNVKPQNVSTYFSLETEKTYVFGPNLSRNYYFLLTEVYTAISPSIFSLTLLPHAMQVTKFLRLFLAAKMLFACGNHL